MKQVIKIGSACHFDGNGEFDYGLIGTRLEEMLSTSHKTVFFVSGAIALGKESEGVTKKTSELTPYERADLAAIGQHYLIGKYHELLGPRVRQVLISPYDWDHGDNIGGGLDYMVDNGRVPLCNTNDPIYFGEQTLDNDLPAVKLAIEWKADRVYLFSRNGALKGFRGKEKELISFIDAVTEDHYSCCYQESSSGTGGMVAKLDAAKRAMQHGIDLVIGDIRDPFRDVVEGYAERTLFSAGRPGMAQRAGSSTVHRTCDDLHLRVH